MSSKKKTALAVLGASLLVSLTAWAYPAPGYHQETWVEYYSDSARTHQVGARAIAHDSSCSTYHITWGSTTSYSRVFVADCPGGGDLPQ